MALETAQQGIKRCDDDVQATRMNLAAGYQGSDGGEFGRLIDKWHEQALIIQKNIQDMITALQTTDRTHTETQSAAVEAVVNASGKSDAAFAAMVG
ncbi:hypothetical protein ACFRI7_02600 [Streptomyces sp. NPDC056716]|uniref:hypothetical protein n=1 Tax=unclassified Streptomyces TaxID=2593676 RepID=UPI0036B8ABA8